MHDPQHQLPFTREAQFALVEAGLAALRTSLTNRRIDGLRALLTTILTSIADEGDLPGQFTMEKLAALMRRSRRGIIDLVDCAVVQQVLTVNRSKRFYVPLVYAVNWDRLRHLALSKTRSAPPVSDMQFLHNDVQYVLHNDVKKLHNDVKKLHNGPSMSCDTTYHSSSSAYASEEVAEEATVAAAPAVEPEPQTAEAEEIFSDVLRKAGVTAIAKALGHVTRRRLTVDEVRLAVATFEANADKFRADERGSRVGVLVWHLENGTWPSGVKIETPAEVAERKARRIAAKAAPAADDVPTAVESKSPADERSIARERLAEAFLASLDAATRDELAARYLPPLWLKTYRAVGCAPQTMCRQVFVQALAASDELLEPVDDGAATSRCEVTPTPSLPVPQGV